VLGQAAKCELTFSYFNICTTRRNTTSGMEEVWMEVHLSLWLSPIRVPGSHTVHKSRRIDDGCVSRQEKKYFRYIPPRCPYDRYFEAYRQHVVICLGGISVISTKLCGADLLTQMHTLATGIGRVEMLDKDSNSKQNTLTIYVLNTAAACNYVAREVVIETHTYQLQGIHSEI
jgi:hypothetical protein